jgi:Matrixin
MRRRLRQLDRFDAGVARPGRRRDALRTAFVALTTIAVVVTVSIVFLGEQWGAALSPLGAGSREPLGERPDVTGLAGSFSFAAHQPGSADEPVTYDPCRPVHVVINDDVAPGHRPLVDAAIREVADATGLHFVMDGSTHELPDENGSRHDLDRAAARDPLVLIAWTTAQHVGALEGRTVGLGGSTATADYPGAPRHYVGGAVSLDAPDLARTLNRPQGRALVQAVVMHELGHVVGLAHVADAHELMNSENNGLTSFGPGDRRGLAALGAGHCFG